MVESMVDFKILPGTKAMHCSEMQSNKPPYVLKADSGRVQKYQTQM